MDKFEYVMIKYWRLDVYSEKTVVYDQKLFEGEYLPELCRIWDIICKCKEYMANGGDILEYICSMENDKNSPFYNGNKRKKKAVPIVMEPNSDDEKKEYENIHIDF